MDHEDEVKFVQEGNQRRPVINCSQLEEVAEVTISLPDNDGQDDHHDGQDGHHEECDISLGHKDTDPDI